MARLETRGVERNQHSALSYFLILVIVSGSGVRISPSPRVCVCVLLSGKMTRNGEYFPGSISLVTFGNYDEEWQEDTSLVRNCSRVQEDKRGIFMWTNCYGHRRLGTKLKTTRFEFLHEFHFIYFLSTIGRLERIFIWRYHWFIQHWDDQNIKIIANQFH